MQGKNRHVVPHDGQWAVRREGTSRVSSIHDTQQEAIQTARDQTRQQKGEMFIHRENGQIRDRESYGNDPCPPRDTR